MEATATDGSSDRDAAEPTAGGRASDTDATEPTATYGPSDPDATQPTTNGRTNVTEFMVTEFMVTVWNLATLSLPGAAVADHALAFPGQCGIGNAKVCAHKSLQFVLLVCMFFFVDRWVD